ADALEHAAPVVQRVGEDVDLGVVPVDELAVHPDLVDLLQGHRGLFLPQTRAATASPIWVVVPATSPASAQALVIRAAASGSPRWSSIIAAETIAASGLARPVPAMSGADPCTGSNSEGPVRAGLRFADVARP